MEMEILSIVRDMCSTLNAWHYLMLFVLFYLAYYYLSVPGKIPPGPRGFPLLGYYPLLTRKPHVKFTVLGKKFGNIVSLYLGNKLVVVLNDFDSMKEVFLYQSHEILTGSENTKSKLWSELKAFTSATLREMQLSNQDFQSLNQKEVDRLVKELTNTDGKSTDIKSLLQSSVFNSVCITLLGNQFDYSEKYLKLKEAMENFQNMSGTFSSKNFFPWMAYLLGKQQKTKKSLQKFQNSIEEILEEKKKVHILGQRQDYVNSYLTEMKIRAKNEDTRNKDLFSDGTLVNSFGRLLSIGSQATANTLMWSILFLMEHPKIQAKIQKEIDDATEGEEPPSWKDRIRTPYTEAALLETLRLISFMPQNSLHRTATDLNINGYKIPKGTLIFANIWNIHHDPDFWKDPEEFKPERFLMENGKIFRPEYHVPFSLGNLKCVAESLTMLQLYTYFTKMLHCFSFERPKDDDTSRNVLTSDCFTPNAVLTNVFLRKKSNN